MSIADLIIEEMKNLADEQQALILARFFQTGKGQYAEGDKFLGIKVPVTRSIVKKYKNEVSINEINQLIGSKYHEIRLAGFLFLLELYKKSVKTQDTYRENIVIDYYLKNIDKGNNWDLVDLIAPYILGDRMTRNPQYFSVCDELSEKENCLWHQRVAIVSTLALIRKGEFDLTFQIAEKFLNHPHHLIHKATGWMLREIGKRGGKENLVAFLEKHKSKMPRTMLRYAIEKFSPEERNYFMS